MESVDPNSILGSVGSVQAAASRKMKTASKESLEQYFTSVPLARMMAAMFDFGSDHIRILDPGAGVGILFAACVDSVLERRLHPTKISVTAYEVDPTFAEDIRRVFDLCSTECAKNGIEFKGELVGRDFIADSVERLGLLHLGSERFNCAILNPPYGKIGSSSRIRGVLDSLGLQSPNYYTAFVDLSEQLLDVGGEMVSITPRSFCNGSYFKQFRKRLLENMSIRRIHLFKSRTESFRTDEVLQENVVLHCVRGPHAGGIVISSSEGPGLEDLQTRETTLEGIVFPLDPESFIRVVSDEIESQILEKMGLLRNTLNDIGVEVSTGRVVDFRSSDFLRYNPEQFAAPLIHPANLNGGGFVRWPLDRLKKPAYIRVEDETKGLLVPRGNYVLVKRFTTNEERKRVVAAVYDADKFDAPLVGFENRVNYFHWQGHGLGIGIAKGLALFLNSTLMDSYFRQISGHTQVNSNDLRNIGYPTLDQLQSLGNRVPNVFPDQTQIDEMVEQDLFGMSSKAEINPVAAKRKVEEALSMLKQLDLPREQQNERSALTLLALLDLKPNDAWSDAKTPLCGITPMMEFFRRHYGKDYAPNSRETVRRFTVHQFLQASLVVDNPDDKNRPTNSPKAVYQIEPKAYELLKTYGTPSWEKMLEGYRTSVKSLREKYAQERDKRLIPVMINDDTTIHLTPGGQNVLTEKIITEFIPQFVGDGKVIYVGDTAEKFSHFDKQFLSELGVEVEPHGKMPDVIVFDAKRNWLLLIEAVTSHGPINPKRKEELQELFASSKAGLVYVTTFLDRGTMTSYLREISWETEVWVAESPTHMIHFNGEKFLGPYET